MCYIYIILLIYIYCYEIIFKCYIFVDKIETRGRHEDPFRKIVSDMMKDIEDQMRKLIGELTI